MIHIYTVCGSSYIWKRVRGRFDKVPTSTGTDRRDPHERHHRALRTRSIFNLTLSAKEKNIITILETKGVGVMHVDVASFYLPFKHFYAKKVRAQSWRWNIECVEAGNFCQPYRIKLSVNSKASRWKKLNLWAKWWELSKIKRYVTIFDIGIVCPAWNCHFNNTRELIRLHC